MVGPKVGHTKQLTKAYRTRIRNFFSTTALLKDKFINALLSRLNKELWLYAIYHHVLKIVRVYNEQTGSFMN